MKEKLEFIDLLCSIIANSSKKPSDFDPAIVRGTINIIFQRMKERKRVNIDGLDLDLRILSARSTD